MTKVLTKFAVMILGVVCLGGCMLKSNKFDVSREKQEEIVKIIVSNYSNITTIEFKDFVYDLKVGEYRILFRVNGYDNGLSFDKKEDIEQLPKIIGLNPVNIFEINRKKQPTLEGMDLENVDIKYLIGR